MLNTRYCNSFITLPQAFGWNNHPVEYVPHLMMMSFVGKPPVNVGIVAPQQEGWSKYSIK